MVKPENSVGGSNEALSLRYIGAGYIHISGQVLAAQAHKIVLLLEQNGYSVETDTQGVTHVRRPAALEPPLPK